MSTTISSCAYTKLILHAAKYPHCAVNGLLLADSKDEGKNVTIVDAVPLFHLSLNLTPMAEVALVQVEEAATARNQKIIGYYCASENYNSNSIDKAPGLRIASKISEHVPNAVFAMIDNRLMTRSVEQPALHFWSLTDGRWQAVERYSVQQQKNTLEATAALVERGASKELMDFDNYLDNTESDWENEHLNRDLNQILALY